MTDKEKDELLKGGIPCSGMISSDPETPIEQAGCLKPATRWVGEYAWCDECDPGWQTALQYRSISRVVADGMPPVPGLEVAAFTMADVRSNRPVFIREGNSLTFTFIMKNGELVPDGLPLMDARDRSDYPPCNVLGCNKVSTHTLRSNVDRYNIGPICDEHRYVVEKYGGVVDKKEEDPELRALQERENVFVPGHPTEGSMKKSRDVRFELRFSTKEYEALAKLADEKGISRADYLRMLVLDKTSQVTHDTSEAVASHGINVPVCNVKGCNNRSTRTLTSNGMPRFNIGRICEDHWNQRYVMIAQNRYYDLKEPVP